ncbi:DUF5682 family protein [Streptomyces sp. NPDC093105]|uniref:DUF5682 family protein n=1 Tax=Streptomyces sp. NPDC093105 TaxID=3366029 RepID=UPI003830AD81
MTVTYLGVRHHSPACARLVARTVERLRPAYVLVEGPSDLDGRFDELLLGHELPVAVFSHYRDDERAATSWTPLCAYSPEWIALTAGRAAGAEVRFIDLPAWHPAFAGRANRYADAELRYAEATARLRHRFAVDSTDALWDRMIEADPDAPDLAERLDTYFDAVRGDPEADAADASDQARETYMAAWIRAARAAAGDRPVLVVTGGFHRPALRRLADAGPGGAAEWPAVPAPPEGSLSGSHLVPYSFRQLDSFAGYESGMPSPAYHQWLWEDGPEAAGRRLVRTVADRLRDRGHLVSTASLVAARASAAALAALRGHPVPGRLDLLDALAGALVTEALDEPLPWTRRGPLTPGAHPAVVEMVAVCAGDRVGRLHPDTPAPPLVHDVAARLTALGLDGTAPVTLRLTDPAGLDRSRLLHRLRVLGIPGYERTAGPADGTDPVAEERWEPRPAAGRDAALVEAGAYGARLDDAALVALGDRARAAADDCAALAGVLFDTVVCGATDLAGPLVTRLRAGLAAATAPGPLGTALATALGLWRHDRVYGVARDPLLAAAVDTAVTRVLWLVEGTAPGGAAGPDRARLRALVAVRDALLHAGPILTVPRDAAADVFRRVAADPAAPPDLRGAAHGLVRVLARTAESGVAEAVRAAAAPAVLGDWLAGLFAVAREEVAAERADGDPGALVGVLDDLVVAMSDTDFLVALPALREAFAWFPPTERERIAARLIERRGLRGSARALLRTPADPLALARARALEDHVSRTLDDLGLGAGR